MTEPGWIAAIIPLLVGLLLLGLLGHTLATGLGAWLRGPWARVPTAAPGRALLAGQLRARGETLEAPDGAPCVWRQRRFRVVAHERLVQGRSTTIRDLSRFLDHAEEEQVATDFFQGSDQALAIELVGAEIEQPPTWIEALAPALFVDRYPALAPQIVPGIERVEIHTSVVPEQARVLVAATIAEARVEPVIAELPPEAGSPAIKGRRKRPGLVLGGSPETPLRLVLGTRSRLVLGALVPAAGVFLLASCLLGLSAVGFYERWIASWISEGWKP